MEREQERDEYHAKIVQLESQLKDRDKKDAVTHRLTSEVCCATLDFIYQSHFASICVFRFGSKILFTFVNIVK